jgi:hypothetical protein
MIVYPHSYLKNPKIVEYASNSSSATNATSYTFPNMNYIGPGYIVVGVVSQVASGNLAAGTCTIGGVSMNNIGTGTFVTTSRIRMTFYGILVNSGTQANIVWTSPGPTCINCGIGVWRLQNASQIVGQNFAGTSTFGAILSNSITNNVVGGAVMISMMSQSLSAGDTSSDQIWINPKTPTQFSTYVNDTVDLGFGGTSTIIQETGTFTLQGFTQSVPFFNLMGTIMVR